MAAKYDVIGSLRALLAADPELEDALIASIVRASDRARAELGPELYAALEWPRDLDGYERFVTGLSRWIPQQTDSPAWRDQDPSERYAKEVSNRLAHFFWLVDQPVGADGATIGENSQEFRDWLTEFARRWGEFLDTTESFGPEILGSFRRNAPEYDVEASLVGGRPNMPSGWVTFNQFFARQLNAGLRPIRDPGTNLTVTSPADCSFRGRHDIDEHSEVPAVRIKHTARYGNIEQLLPGSRFADAFGGGTFVHYMLPPSAYHRFHMPVAGRVQEAFVVQGRVYLQVDIDDGELISYDCASTGYEFSQTRGVVTIDTAGSAAGDVGVVGVVPVGMAHVASVVLTATAGRDIAKGEEFGYFQFGGSDIILLFQAGAQPDIDTDPAFRLVGSAVAHCRGRSGDAG